MSMEYAPKYTITPEARSKFSGVRSRVATVLRSLPNSTSFETAKAQVERFNKAADRVLKIHAPLFRKLADND